MKRSGTSYLVKGSDPEIDVVTDDHQNEQDVPEYWSLTKAIAYPQYDSHTIKLICEVPVLDEATQTYYVNPDVVPGTLFVGSDAEGNKNPNAELNNYGDIVPVPESNHLPSE